jgi:hypothetical protein
LDGKCFTIYRNGLIHETHWTLNCQKGTGTYIYPNGLSIKGDVSREFAKGEASFPTGKYTGEFVYGKRHGKGKFVYENGDVYIGDFRNDCITGKGVYLWANGEKYIGRFKSGVMTGRGYKKFNNEDFYSGMF